MFFKRHKGKLIAAGIIFVLLGVAFFSGGGVKDGGAVNGGAGVQPPASTAATISLQMAEEVLQSAAEPSDTPMPPGEAAGASEEPESETAGQKEPGETAETAPSPEKGENPSAGKVTQPAGEKPEGSDQAGQGTGNTTQTPDEPSKEQDTEQGEPDGTFTCILSVRCDTILSNMGRLNPDKVGLVPGDGVILPPTTVTVNEGETVFQVLRRELKRAKIHLEFKTTPGYHSAYIEGILNLYEFDCGELSGWMYRVNGQFPNYGCSRYQLKAGDKIEWVYTCDLGRDVGGSGVVGNN